MQPTRFRLLPEGEWRHAEQVTLNQTLLELEAEETEGLRPGSALEVETAEFVYLGVVQVVSAKGLVLLVEHAVDLRRIADLERIWGPSQSGPL
jgi:hypothetical protein